jgi:hypothetical protein
MYQEEFSKIEKSEYPNPTEKYEIPKIELSDIEEAEVYKVTENPDKEYIEYREPTKLIKEVEKESLIESNNCPQEITQEFQESTFKEKFTSWQYIALINLLCKQKENGLMITINYRSLGTTALAGFFADWRTVIGSAEKIFQSAFNFPQVVYVELHFYNPYLDEFGNRYLKHEVTMSVDRELAEKINWENITENMFWSLLSKRGLIERVDGEEIRDN